MKIWDLKDIFAIDQKIRETGASATYKDFTTQQVFGRTSDNTKSRKVPTAIEVAKLVELGFVAEVDSIICGFVVGRQTYIFERDIQQGEIVIIGVDPDYRGKGMATKLVNNICDLFRSRDVQQIRSVIDPQDKELSAFLERQGFKGEQRLHYLRIL